ncbi:superinfection immunity protein [Natranaerofaba carboxydovora]|uniref:superinfection immunity protein n=1 Tax=Natranaerofaba carboxydovora TaxID=2742683 RepID=UPI001F1384D3|nr:superinfection immunity protein [Natranaerofaba carboxydovora]UMZ72550.1 Superinfection immunity protein [Natranaerofaba carboxydovora]
METIMSIISALIIITIAVLIYFAPAFVAEYRNHKNARAISVLNLFLGWTFVFWVLALVWAFLSNQEESTEET